MRHETNVWHISGATTQGFEADMADPLLLPRDHPVMLRASAPPGDGPEHWHGFDAFCGEVQEALAELHAINQREYQMIRDTTAQRIASEWHSGQTSPLYALSSSGAILGESSDEYEYNLAAREIQQNIDQRVPYPQPLTKMEQRDLTNLLAYVKHYGPRDAVTGWYERVICKV